MLKKYLITPGPVSVPEQVLLDMARPMIHHRTPEFEEIFKEARNGLKKVFKTEQEPLILASSGTGAMESAVINTLNQGDKVLVINGGKFGERWIKICQAYGINAESVTIEWGRSVNPADVKAFLDKNPDTKAVFVQGSETSSTVYHPVKELAAITKDMPDDTYTDSGWKNKCSYPYCNPESHHL